MQTIYLAEGCTENDINGALAMMRDGGTLVLPTNSVISIAHGLSLTTSDRDITLDLNGSVLQQAGDNSVIYGGGSMGVARSVALSYSDQNTVITYDSVPNDLKVGSWIKMAADDLLPNDNRNTEFPTRMGQSMQIASIEGNVVTLTGKPLYPELYTQNVRAATISSGQLKILNGTIQGDQSHATWINELVQIRDAVGTYIEGVTVRDGNSMGINLVNNVNAKVVDSMAINLKDDVNQGYYGYGVHSASSLNTTVIGLYAERVRHATDDNGVGIEPNNPYLAKYGADIGLTVKSSVSYYASAFSYSFHSEGRNGLLDDVMSFESHGFVGLRGVGQTVTNSASVGDERGFQFYEYGYGDAKDMKIGNVIIRESGLYVYVVSGNPTNNTISNSYFEYDYRPGNPGTTTLINTTVVKTGETDNNLFVGTDATDRLLGGRGDDVIRGGGGDDYIWGGQGQDMLQGGAGRDRFAFHDFKDQGFDVISDFQAGANGDFIDISILVARYGWKGDIFTSGHIALTDVDGGTLFQIVENPGSAPVSLALLNGVSSSQFTSDNLQTTISGGAGTYAPPPPPTSIVTPGSTPYVRGVTINGTDAADLIDATHSTGLLPTTGNDYITTGNGNDYVDGLGGADTVLLGAGNDTVVYYSGVASNFNGGSGRDTLILRSSDIIDLSATKDQSEGLPTFGGFDDVDGRTSNVPLTIIGDDNNNNIWGGNADDRLTGKGGNDQIDGGAGNDTVIYEGDRNDYSFIKINDFTWRVQDLRAAVPYRDYVKNVERVSFQDQLSFIDTLNRAPTDILLDNTSVSEKAAIGTVIGKITGVDLDVSEINTIELLDSAGGYFGISGVNLVTLKPLDFETQKQFAVVIRLTDSAGHPIEKTFNVDILDVNEAPSSVSDVVDINAGGRIVMSAASGMLMNVADPESDVMNVLSARGADGTWYASIDQSETAIQGKYGLLLVNQSGAYTYMQDAAILGPLSQHAYDDFEYRVVDANGNSTVSAVRFWIDRSSEINPDSVVIDLDSQSHTVDASHGVLANDTDRDGDTLTIADNSLQIKTGLFGYLQFAADGSYSYVLTQRPVGNAQTDSFSYSISDGKHNYDATIEFQIAPQVPLVRTLLGTQGADTLYLQKADYDIVDGQGASDTLIVTGDKVQITPVNGQANFFWGEGSGTSAVSIENFSVTGNDVKVEGNFAGIVPGSFELRTANSGGRIDAGKALGFDGFKMIGSQGADTLIGSSGNDVLDGKLGADYLAGGKGDDIYVVSDMNANVFENAASGRDQVITSLETYTLSSNFEDLIYTGSKRITATGNELANYIQGGAGADRIDGKLGADIMAGGKGDDTYIVESAGDRIVESGNSGSDRALASVSYVLDDNVENLQLTTSAKLNGTGNSLANLIIGNNGQNIIDGRGGADTLTGGLGDDTFIFRFGETAGDSVTDFQGAGQQAGDVIRLIGFGDHASVTQVGTSDYYTVSAGDHSETFQLVNVFNLSAKFGDVLFV